MSGHRKWADLRAPVDPARRARIDEEKRIMGAVQALTELRTQRGVSQEGLARAWETSQPNVSKIERQDDLLVSTVRRYVESLGGRLELRAVFPDQTVQLGLGDTPSMRADTIQAAQHDESSPTGHDRGREHASERPEQTPTRA